MAQDHASDGQEDRGGKRRGRRRRCKGGPHAHQDQQDHRRKDRGSDEDDGPDQPRGEVGSKTADEQAQPQGGEDGQGQDLHHAGDRRLDRHVEGP
jgi:hypothetical protein